eukprot:gene10832-41713_t
MQLNGGIVGASPPDDPSAGSSGCDDGSPLAEECWTTINSKPVPRRRRSPSGHDRNVVVRTRNGNGSGDAMPVDSPAAPPAVAKKQGRARNRGRAKKGNLSDLAAHGKQKRMGSPRPAVSAPHAAAAFYASTVRQLQRLKLSHSDHRVALREAAQAAARVAVPLPAPPPPPPPPPATPAPSAAVAPAPAKPALSESAKRRARRKAAGAKAGKESPRDGSLPPDDVGSAAVPSPPPPPEVDDVSPVDRWGIPLTVADLSRHKPADLERSVLMLIGH